MGKHHYLNRDIPTSAVCWGLFSPEDEQVGFIAIRHMPHPNNHRLKMIHRLVILPDYQGIGLGGQFLDMVAGELKRQGHDVRIITSAKNLIHKLQRVNNWKLVRWGQSTGGLGTMNYKMKKALRKVKTASFKYMGA